MPFRDYHLLFRETRCPLFMSSYYASVRVFGSFLLSTRFRSMIRPLQFMVWTPTNSLLESRVSPSSAAPLSGCSLQAGRRRATQTYADSSFLALFAQLEATLRYCAHPSHNTIISCNAGGDSRRGDRLSCDNVLTSRNFS